MNTQLPLNGNKMFHIQLRRKKEKKWICTILPDLYIKLKVNTIEEFHSERTVSPGYLTPQVTREYLVNSLVGFWERNPSLISLMPQFLWKRIHVDFIFFFQRFTTTYTLNTDTIVFIVVFQGNWDTSGSELSEGELEKRRRTLLEQLDDDQ